MKIFSPPPCIRSTRCFRVVVIPSSNCLEYSLQEYYLGWIMFILFALNVICFGNMLPTFVLYTLMCRKYIGRPWKCHVKAHDLMHLDIFYSPTTTPKSVYRKHPDLFRKFNKHLIVELRMCENTYLGVIIFRHFIPDSAFRTHTVLIVMDILPNTFEIIYPK